MYCFIADSNIGILHKIPFELIKIVSILTKLEAALNHEKGIE
jgi:flagellin-specific chaperone FliS